MKRPADIFRSRFQRCRHYHVSGRRCGSKVPKGTDHCQSHLVPCKECETMKVTFIPPKGW